MYKGIKNYLHLLETNMLFHRLRYSRPKKKKKGRKKEKDKFTLYEIIALCHF